MTLDEFKNTRMGPGDKMRKKSDGEVYQIVATDFEESLFAHWPDEEKQDTRWWVRCENVEFIPFNEVANNDK